MEVIFKLDFFYKNQNVFIETANKTYRGYINKIALPFLTVTLYSSYSEGRPLPFGSEDYDMASDEKVISGANDLTLICPEDPHTLVFKIKAEEIYRNPDSISVKVKVSPESEERKSREFLRIDTSLQFIYEEIPIEEFLKIKDGYITKPSFTTSVYGLYNVPAPRFYQQMFNETDSNAPINPAMEKLLVAINSKLDVILSLLNPDVSIFSGIKEKTVSISGSGIMWIQSIRETDSGRHHAGGRKKDSPDEESHGQPLKKGSILKLTMLFPAIPQFVIRAIGQAVRISSLSGDNGDNSKRIACKFIAINESDRDEIIKFTLEKQRQLIKKPSQPLI